MTQRRLFPLLCALALAACSEEPERSGTETVTETPETRAPAPEASHQETEVVFRCNDGGEFTATFGAEVVWLTENDQEQELRQQPAEAGERYTGDGLELIVRDDQVVLVTGEETRDCTRLEAKQLSLPGSARGTDAG